MNQPDNAAEDRLKSFDEFWPFYVREHAHAATRALHFAGSTLGLACLAEALLAGNLWFILLGLIIGYALAWVGHFFIEHNRPATFKYPLWSFRADWKMWALMLARQMEPEVRRATERV